MNDTDSVAACVRAMSDDALWLCRVYRSQVHDDEIRRRPALRARREAELAADDGGAK